MASQHHTCTSCDTLTRVSGRNNAEARRNVARMGDLCETCEAKAAAANADTPIAQFIALGGREWTGDDGERRVYLNEPQRFVTGLDYTVSNSGRYEHVSLDGESLSNNKGSALVSTIRAARVYYDVVADELVVSNASDEHAARIRGDILAAIGR